MLLATPHTLCLRSRFLSAISTRRLFFKVDPSPLRLPIEEQKEFERLQKLSSGSFSTPKHSTMKSDSQILHDSSSSLISKVEGEATPSVEAKVNGQELHRDIRRGSAPEFEGEKNPMTGEIGGPKTEPLRWGSTGDKGDWSYNGRVTDF